ncbi:MAG: PD-(D/E)XK nuclease family protein [Bacilli bacterium]|nr:PD-(D/E)XK nuclease family protein [Bacilli bacterium]
MDEKISKLNHKLIIAPNSYRRYLLNLKNNNPTLDFKLLTKEELINKYYFEVRKNADLFLAVKYNLSLDYAESLITNMHFFNECDLANKKINDIKTYYEILKQNGYIREEPLFHHELKVKDIVVVGYDRKDKEINRILSSYNYEFVELFPKRDAINYRKFNTAFEEVSTALNEIALLYDKGVSFNNIKIVCATKEYDYLLLRLSKFYNIPLSDFISHRISQSQSFKKLDRKILMESELYFKGLEEEIIEDKLECGVRNDILTFYNEFKQIESLNQSNIDLFMDVLKSQNKSELKYDNVVQVMRKVEIPSSNEYVYVLGFQNGVYPNYVKDDNFIRDSELDYLSLSNSIDKSHQNKIQIMDFINSSENIYLSFKTKTGTEVYHESFLINEYSINKEGKNEDFISFSLKAACLKYAFLEDDNVRYHKINDEYYLLKNNLPNIYGIYSSDFNGIDVDYDNENKTYSYTSISKYYVCKFQYFCESILRIKESADTINLKLGNIAHTLFENSYMENFDFDVVLDKCLAEQKCSTVEALVIKNLSDQIKYFINFNHHIEDNLKVKETLKEYKITIELNEKSKLFGKIDKIAIAENEEAYIIDYKTSHQQNFKMENFENKLSLQLPIYALLFSTYEETKDYQFIGAFLQSCVTKNKVLEDDIEVKEKKYAKDFKIRGIVKNDALLLKDLNLSYGCTGKSKNIEVDKSIINEIITKCKNLLNEADFAIRKGEFDINPYFKGKGGVMPCTYCNYKDICFYQLSKKQKRIIIENNKNHEEEEEE